MAEDSPEPVQQIIDKELVERIEQWFRENTDGASLVAAQEVIAVVHRLEARVEQLSEALVNTRKEVRYACYRLWDQNKTADEKLKRADLDLRRVHECAGKALSEPRLDHPKDEGDANPRG